MSVRDWLAPSLRFSLRLALIAALSTALLSGVYWLSRERILAEQQRAKLTALTAVLPASGFDNDPLSDQIQVIAPDFLGSDKAQQIYRVRNAGKPVAILLETIAPDGYTGKIKIIIGIDSTHKVIGVRVIEHQETPGLGDWIEAKRSDWIETFRGKNLQNPLADRWLVKKDGGDFDQFAGATITPRAVVKAIKLALEFEQKYAAQIYAQTTNQTLVISSDNDAKL